MSVASLTQELEELPSDEPFDWIAFSRRVNEEFAAATTSQERAELLATRAIAIELVMRQLQLHGEHLEKFTDACELEYKRFIVQETLLNGVVSYQAMLHVTDREIAAGRMSEDYALRAIAIEERPEAALAEAPKSDEVHTSTPGRFSKLKHWLHID